MILSAFGYGSGRSNTALTMLKIAVLAPIPSASVITATEENAGFLMSCRSARRRLLIPKGNHWIDTSGATSRSEARRCCDDGKDCAHSKINRGIERVHLEQDVLQGTGREHAEKQCCSTSTKNESNH